MISEIIDNTCINAIAKIEASVLLPIVLFQMTIPRYNSLNSLRYSQSERARFTSFISLSLTFTPLLLFFFFAIFPVKPFLFNFYPDTFPVAFLDVIIFHRSLSCLHRHIFWFINTFLL